MNILNTIFKTAAGLLLLSCFFAENAYSEGKFVPLDGRIMVFAGQNNESFEDYVNTTDMLPAGFMIYTSVQSADGLDEPSDYGAGETSAKYLLENCPDTAMQIGLYMVEALDGVYGGQYNENIDKIGSFIKSSKRPVYLRIGYEFDGPHNHYEPSKYIKAYRYIVDRFRKNGVNNVAYVWHSYASYPPVMHMKWYPGDSYVDWFGISFFAQNESEMLPVVNLAKQHNKPVMIAESSPSGIGTKLGEESWKKWFRRYFIFVEKYNISAICYINCNWDTLPMFKSFNWGDCRLGSNKVVKQKWIDEISKYKYLQSSEEMFETIGFEGQQ